MQETLNSLFGLAGLALLYFGAEGLVKGGCAIAARCRVPPLVVGLTLVAFGTSAPELFVSTDAALRGLGDMAVGNVVGSNTCNIALILGLSALITPLGVNPTLFRRDVPLMVIASLATAVLCGFFGGIGRLAAAVLFIGLLVNTFLGIREGRAADAPADEQPTVVYSWLKSLVLVLGGLGALVVGSKLLLKAAVYLAARLGIPDGIVALTVVAVGTSLPELATSVVAAIKGERDIAIGNVVGSNVFNLLGILGFSALLAPVTCPGIDEIDLAIMVFTAILLWPIMKTGHRITRGEGAFLLLIYVAYTAWLVVKSCT